MIIKYTYIPEGDTDALYEVNAIDELETAVDNPCVDFIDIEFINNLAHGINFDDDLFEYISYCSQDDLLETFKEVCESDVKNIVINCFDITIDSVRKDFLKIARDNEITSLYINVYSDKHDEPIHIGIEEDADTYSDEEWEEQNERIEKEIEKITKKKSTSKMKKAPVASDEIVAAVDHSKEKQDSLKKIFEMLLDENTGIQCKLEGLDVDVKETLSYVNEKAETHVSILTDGSLMISDDKSDVLIDPTMVEFLADAIKKLTKSK